MAYRQDLDPILNPAVTAMGYELVGCEFLHQDRSSILRVFIDSPQGITLEDCERVSKQISAILDVEDPFQTHYSLEVSSPGLERPLFIKEHYNRHIGAQVKIKLRTPLEDRKLLTGTIQAVSDEAVSLMLVDDKVVVLPFSQISKANLVPDTVVKGAQPRRKNGK